MKKIILEGLKILLSLSVEIVTFTLLLLVKYFSNSTFSNPSRGFEILTLALFSLAFGLSVKSYILNQKINKTLDTRILSISESLSKVPNISILAKLIMKTFSAIENNNLENRDLSTRLTNLLLDRNIQNIQTETLEIFASNLADDSIKKFLDHCAKETLVFKGTCLTKMNSFWFNNKVGPEFFCMNLEYMKENKGFMTERIFVVQSDEWRTEEPAKHDLIKVMTRNNMKCFVVNESTLDTKIRDFCIFYSVNKPIIAMEWDVDKTNRANKITIIYNKNKMRELHNEWEQIWRETTPELQTFKKSEISNLPTTVKDCKTFLMGLGIKYKG